MDESGAFRLPGVLAGIALCIGAAMGAPDASASAQALGQAGLDPVAERVRIDGQDWTRSTNGEDVPWAQADGYCRDLELAGHDDWRLPTLAELEALHAPDADDGLAAPLRLDGCCIWSSTSLADRAADRGGPGGGAPSQYFWGFLFDGGTRYYSFRGFPDGQALCVRDAD